MDPILPRDPYIANQLTKYRELQALRRLARGYESRGRRLALGESPFDETDSDLTIDIEGVAGNPFYTMGREEHNFHPADYAVAHSPVRGMNPPVFRLYTVSPRRVLFVAWLLLCVVLSSSIFAILGAATRYRESRLTGLQFYNATVIADAAFQPPEAVYYRAPDVTDTFEYYKYRDVCNVSSKDLHAPFSPLCKDRQSMLTAMSSGGRIGQDAPYMPRGCDMRWFTTEEVCEILSRFQKVIIVGDSMMRHIIGSLYVLMRKDLGYGAVTDWNFSPQERKDCFCNRQFNVKTCSVQGIYKTADVVKNDPESFACEVGTFDVMIELIVKFPIPKEEIDRFKANIGTRKPTKPYAFIFGHGLWNDIDLQATVDWLDTLLDATRSQLPYLSESSAFWPRLFVTPNAAGPAKQDEFLVTQGNKALMLFEESVKIEAGRRGVEHLGTWNMSIQANKYDGVHVDLKGNLVKAMMVLNWLNMLDVEKH